MQSIPYEKMICDSDYGDGGVYFYNDYIQWINRDNGTGFKIHYLEIKDVQVVMSHKKKIIITLNDGTEKHLYLYRYETFLELLYAAIDRAKNPKKEEEKKTEENKETKEDVLSQLERLAKLHESGALNDEEFAKAKQKILG